MTPWNISFDRQLPMKSKPLTNASSFSHGAAPNQKHYMDVSSTGNVSATFQVPGLVSIPSKKSFHKVTIAKVDLDAKMSWLCVPKKGAKTYLNVSTIYYYVFLGIVLIYFVGEDQERFAIYFFERTVKCKCRW